MHISPVTVASMLGIFLAACPWALGQELLTNGDFEGGFQSTTYGDVGNGWNPAGRPDLSGAAFTSQYYETLGYYQRVRSSELGKEAGIGQRVTGLVPGKRVTFSGKAYQKAPGCTVWVAIDPDGAIPSGSLPACTTQVPSTSGSWTRFEVSATVGSSGTIGVYLWAYMQSGSLSYMNTDALSLVYQPASMSDLAAPGTLSDAIRLRWTAPVGASKYEIRYSTQPITESNWSSATLVLRQATPAVAAPGSTQETWFRNLAPDTTYYVGIKYQRSNGSWSDLGPTVVAVTQPQGSAPYWAWKLKERLTEQYNATLQDCLAAAYNTGHTADVPDNPLKWYFGGWDPDCEAQVGIGSVLTIVRDPWLLDFWRNLSDHVWDLNFTNTSLDKNYYNSTFPHQRRPAWNESHHGGEASWNGVGLIFHDYDNPKWLDRATQYAALVHNWTGYTGNPPHLHFKTLWVKEAEWDYSAVRGVQSLIDVPEDRRFTRALVYAAWRDPDARMPDGQTIRDFLNELDSSQAEDAMKTDLGKPVGLMPGEIRFDTHTIGGYSGQWWRAAGSMGGEVGTSSEWWYDWRVGWVQARDSYFNLVDHYLLHGDMNARNAVAETIRYFSVQQARNNIPPAGMDNPPTGNWPDSNEAWGHYQYLVNYVYRNATNDTQFDANFLGHAQVLWSLLPNPGTPRYPNIIRSTLQWDTGSPASLTTCTPRQPFFLAWRITRDKEWLARAVDELFWVDVPAWLESVYNGDMTLGLLRSPVNLPLTWNNTTAFTNFAAVVLDSSKTHLKWQTYNFDPHDKRMSLWLWQLQPGTYMLRHGRDANLDDQMDAVEGTMTLTCGGPRTPVDIVMPAGRMQIFQIEPANCAGDPDTDGDGTTDCEDVCPTDPGKTAPGPCGCNVADTDSDSDGVPDCLDTCPGTMTGAAVDAAGCPLPVPGDMDRDGDVDQEDFGCFQACLTGSSFPQLDLQCQAARLDGDLDVDGGDLSLFRRCMSGANVPASPGCSQ